MPQVIYKIMHKKVDIVDQIVDTIGRSNKGDRKWITAA